MAENNASRTPSSLEAYKVIRAYSRESDFYSPGLSSGSHMSFSNPEDAPHSNNTPNDTAGFSPHIKDFYLDEDGGSNIPNTPGSEVQDIGSLGTEGTLHYKSNKNKRGFASSCPNICLDDDFTYYDEPHKRKYMSGGYLFLLYIMISTILCVVIVFVINSYRIQTRSITPILEKSSRAKH